jgi:Transglutaminase-like superfamily
MEVSMFTRALWIAADVYLCITVDGAVLLDLKRDRYLGLARRETEMLGAVVQGWPALAWKPECGGLHETDLSEIEKVCAPLLKDGLLARERVVGREDPRVDMHCDFISVGDELETHGPLRMGHVLRFLRAFVWTRWQLRWRRIASTVEKVRSNKRAGVRAGKGWDVFEMAALIDAFRRLRPFAFAAEGHCLLHALTLVRFLSYYGCYPEWVFGVATQPWSAHSWVQWGRFLLDTNPEKICRHTPILVI